MTDPSPYLNIPPETLAPHLEALADLFGRMEKAYNAVAAVYGFECTGCEDNCCLTRFYHHTLLEYLYLKRGWGALSASARDRLQQRAARVNQEVGRADAGGQKIRIMCPLNEAGRCVLYQHRPKRPD